MNALVPRASRPTARRLALRPKHPPGSSRAPADVNEGCRGKSSVPHAGRHRPCARRRRSATLGPRTAFLVAELHAQMPFIRAIRGRMGDIVFKTYGRKIIVTRVPTFADYEPSAAQRARRDRMRAATAYAQQVYARPAAKALYLAVAKKLDRQAFRLAVSDYLTDHPRVTQVASLCPLPAVRPLISGVSLPPGHPPAVHRISNSPALIEVGIFRLTEVVARSFSPRLEVSGWPGAG